MTLSLSKKIQKKVGKYDWILGDKGNDHVKTLMTFITADALKTLVIFNKEAFWNQSYL